MEGDHLEDPGVDERMMLKLFFKSWMGCIDWIDLAQDKDRWRAVVNKVMKYVDFLQ